MEHLKEVFETITQRIKSPFLGYITLSFFLINWKPLYYIVFSGESTLVKFSYFDAQTTSISLIFLPILVGTLLALASPWIGYAGAYWAAIPITKKRILIAEAANKIRELRTNLREGQNREINAILEAVKQDREVQKIENEQLRAQIEQQIAETRHLPKIIQQQTGKMVPTSKIEVIKEQAKLLEKQSEMAKEHGDLYKAEQLLEEASELFNQAK